MRLEGLFTPEASGSWEFGLVMIGQGKLYVDDELVVDNWADQKPGQELFGFGVSRPSSDTVPAPL
jgi:beta-glucosidase